MRYIGGHVSTSGGLFRGIEAASMLGINTIQIHPTAPQRWCTSPIDMAPIETLVKTAKNSPVRKIFAHAIYLINLAQPDKQKFHLSKMALVTYLNFMRDIHTVAEHYHIDIEAAGVVVHVGSGIHYPTKKDALDRVLYGINWILEEAPIGKLLLESAAGAGQVIGAQLEDLVWLKENVEQKERLGICLDTQHMFASGYDWRDPNTVVKMISNVIPDSYISCFHLNDSKVPFDSKKDRHENLGEGEIGAEAMKQIVNHPALTNIPMILEVPRMKSPEEASIEFEKIRTWIQSS